MGETFNGVEVPDDPEMVSFGLIASAGEARSLAFQALAEAKAGNCSDGTPPKCPIPHTM